MPVFDNLNYSHSPGVAPAVVQYYERTLLENMKPDMVHARDTQKRTLPLNNGKTVNFRRFTPFPAVTTPLSEGVTPEGQSLEETAFTVMVKPYGRHVELTDEINLYMLDNIHQETARLLADQASLSLDTIARDAENAGMNVQYAGGKTSRSALASTDKLTYADIKKAVRTLKRRNVRPFPDGFYHAIVHPDVVHDLTGDVMWTDVAKYQDKQLAVTAYDPQTRCATISDSLTSDQARELTGKLVSLGYTESTANKTMDMCVERVDYAAKKVFFRWGPADVTGWTGITINATGGGASGVEVYSTLIYGQDAFGSIELGGNGKNVSVIFKAPGSSGALDPLDQRGTVAWKVKGFCVAILQDDFVVRVESAATG